jgi:predicted 3-demethylubiquinone-9 3-methyltransferase (glyoxalase superfamily)
MEIIEMETQVITQLNKNSMETRHQKITPFLWFDSNAEEAVKFYSTVFTNTKTKTITRYSDAGSRASGMQKGSVMTISFQIEGYEIVAINGGPFLKINPSLSFFVNCQSTDEIDTLWNKLSKNGNVMMPLDNYPFAEKYGWIQDQFGVSWQLIIQDRQQKITPCLMFSGTHHLMAEKAIQFYTALFKNSGIIELVRYGSDVGPEGAIVHCKFSLEGQEFVAMDSHEYMPVDFTPGVSMVVNCDNQKEIDYYWDKLAEGGDENAQQCGWLQDQFGFSWQVVPPFWADLMQDGDPSKAERAMAAVLKMKKIIIDEVQRAIDLV